MRDEIWSDDVVVVVAVVVVAVGGDMMFGMDAFLSMYCSLKELFEADCRVLLHCSTG